MSVQKEINAEFIDGMQRLKNNFISNLSIHKKFNIIEASYHLLTEHPESHLNFHLRENGIACRSKKKTQFIFALRNNFSIEKFSALNISFNFFNIMASTSGKKYAALLDFDKEEMKTVREIKKQLEFVLEQLYHLAEKRGLSGIEIIRAIDTFKIEANDNFTAYLHQSFNYYKDDAIDNGYYSDSKSNHLHIPSSSLRKFSSMIEELKNYIPDIKSDGIDMTKITPQRFEEIYGDQGSKNYEFFISVYHGLTRHEITFSDSEQANSTLDENYCDDCFEDIVIQDIDRTTDRNKRFGFMERIERKIDPGILSFIYKSEEGKIDLNSIARTLNTSPQNINLKLSRLVRKLVTEEI